MLSTTRPCQRIRLATRGAATIDTCSCGAVHVTLGPATLRLTAEGFDDLVELVGEASEQLTRRAGARVVLLPGLRGDA